MLTSQQKRYLKSLAHAQKPVVILGKEGLSQAVLREIDRALDHHELIKIRIVTEHRETRDLLLQKIADATGAETIQRIGHMASLFRRNPEKPRISLT